ncbi:MAG: hypothetical protein QXJ93_01315 [Candidatus Rehaiarchaeum fermentans]|nr:hypothetical protein [Candidatus Rehaiarchaeum fermentans]
MQNTSSYFILGNIPHYGIEYINRTHKIKIKIIPENKEFVESDGTGLKTSNAGGYRQFKYGDPNAKRKKYLVVIIIADVKKKELQYLKHIQGEGQSEPKVAEKQIKEANGNGYKIKKFSENVKVEWQGNKNKEERSNFCHGISNAQIYTGPFKILVEYFNKKAIQYDTFVFFM